MSDDKQPDQQPDATPGLWQSESGGIVLAFVSGWQWMRRYRDSPHLGVDDSERPATRQTGQMLQIQMVNGGLRYIHDLAMADRFVLAMNFYYETKR